MQKFVVQRGLRQVSKNQFRSAFHHSKLLASRSFGHHQNGQQHSKGEQQKWRYMATAAVFGFGAYSYLMKKTQEQPDLVSASAGMKLVEVDFANELGEGDMRELKVGEGKQDKVLVSKVKGDIHAVGAFCSHFGLPLSQGALFDDKVLCPAHAAGFSVVTGAIDSGPGRDGIPKYKVAKQGSQYFVEVPEDGIKQKKVSPMTKRDPNDSRNFVVVGGGAAGLNCAETLRQSGFTGKITLISAEKTLPYDRTLLTKALAVGDASKWALRDEQFMKDFDIDVVYDKLYAIHADKKMLTFARGQPMSYEKLLVATGGVPREAKWIKGIDAKNVFNLRDAADQTKIKEKAKTVKDGVAILGSSFIGSEAAAALRMKYKDEFAIHMIGLEEYPIEKVFGKEIGKMMANEHEKHGVTLHMKKDIKEIVKNSEGEIEAILLDDGSKHQVSMLVCGLGILPQTNFLEKHETGVKTDKQGAIVCDPFLQSSVQDIYAAGDNCAYPYWQTGKAVRVEHWIHAMDQGAYAAFNMLGKFIPYGNTPFFWTRHYNKSMQYVGHCVGYDEVIIHGDVSAQKFIAYYVKDNKIQAASGMGMSVAVLTMFEAFNQNKVPSVEDIRSGKTTPETLRQTLKLAPGRGCTRANCCSK